MAVSVVLYQDIVRTRGKKKLQREIPTLTAMYWVPEDGSRKMGTPKKTWRSTFKEDLEEIGVSWHGSRRIASDFSSHDAPRGAGGPKSKYIINEVALPTNGDI